MRYSILGFNQERVIEAGLDLTDIVLLQYIMQANGSPDMQHIIKDEVSYVWLSHAKLREDLPILNIAEGTLRNRLSNLKKRGLLQATTISFSNGFRAYYSLTLRALSFLNDKPCHSEVTSPCHFKMTTDSKLIDNKLIDNKNSTIVELAQPTAVQSEPSLKTKSDTTKTSPLVDISSGTPKKKEKKKNLYEKCLDEIDAHTDNQELRNKLQEFLKIRLTVKEPPLFIPKWRCLLNDLTTLADNDEDRLKIVRQSIEKGWLSFYELKQNKGQYGGKYGKDKFNEFGVVKSVTVNEEDITDEAF